MKKNSNRPVFITLFVVAILLFFWFGFSVAKRVMGYEQAAGFRLPPGDVGAGMVAFRELGCANCHSVAGSVEFPMPEAPQEWHVVLGGEVHVVKTYGELVTAVIHPSESIRPEVHKTLVNADGKSIMPDLTWQMTTRQMIDLVTFLQPQYKVVMPEYPTNYYPYGIDVAP